MLHRILSTPISSNLSLVAIRDRSRQIGELFGLDNLQRTRFITAISEIARNAVQFAGGATLTFLAGDAGGANGVQCVVAQIIDKGPGIADVQRLLSESTHHTGPGVGIPGSRRMTDGFSIETELGHGTTVTLEMFLPRGTPPLTTRQLDERIEVLTRRKAQTPVQELEQQNREMLLALEELRRKKKDLEDADMRKNEFLAMLAHELRNPLAAISLSLEVAKRSATPMESKLAGTFGVIGRQTEQLSRMVNDLLDVSRLTRGKVEIHTELARIDSLIDSAIEMTEPELYRRGHRVAVQYPAKPTFVSVDVARLKQVFNNIIHNAARYTPQSDEIRITVTVDEQDVSVEVADRGIGIDAEMLPRIFDLFTQASQGIDRQDAGLGIGLTVVDRLVRDHGGSVEVRSDGLGHGSTFTVVLPVADEPVSTPVPEAAVKGTTAHNILIVDDNVDSADALAALLEMSGNTCHVVYDGRSAVAAGSRIALDLAIIDIGLPDMRGFEVARELRAQHPDRLLTLVALSGYSTPEFHQEAEEAGFDHYFAKPLPIDQFLELISNAGAA
ncbi:MAG: ATP-binding response regulator [Janthinobacterium lividum]